MSAGEVVRAALLAALRADPRFAGIGTDGGAGEVADRQLPSLRVDAPQVADWSTKDAAGREVRTAVALRVAAGQADRLPALVAAAEGAGVALGGDLDGWRVASAVLLRSASFSPDARVRAALVEHRVRVLQAPPSP